MKRYKRLFKESVNDDVASKEEAEQIVDISNLQWGKTFKSDWNSAESNCPSGWRLPTIQELYTAYVQKVSGFKTSMYWSSSSKNSEAAWYFGFIGENTYSSYKTANYNVRCVREI